MAEDEKPRLYFVKDKLDAVERLEVEESVKSVAKDLNVSNLFGIGNGRRLT